MVSSEDITIVQGGKNAEEISRVVEQVKEASITHLNHTEIVGKVNSRVQIIESQINNNHMQYVREAKKLEQIKERIGKPRMDNLKAQNIVPSEMFEQINIIAWNLQEMLAWKLVEFELVYPLMDKLSDALSIVGAYEVESRVLDGVKESQNRMLTHAENMMTNKMSQQDQKIDLVKEFVNERTQMILEKQLMQFRDLQRLQQEADEKKWQLIIDFVEKNARASGTRPEDISAMKKSLTGVDAEGTRKYIEEQSKVVMPVREGVAGKQLFTAPPPMQKRADAREVAVEDKLYACPKCSARFKDDLQLEAHIEFEHGDEDDGGN